jgi:D-ribose pyranose/furanose isomerase RbsD
MELIIHENCDVLERMMGAGTLQIGICDSISIPLFVVRADLQLRRERPSICFAISAFHRRMTIDRWRLAEGFSLSYSIDGRKT